MESIQRDCRQALLAVNNKEFVKGAVIMGRDKAAKEVTFPLQPDNLDNVVKELLALFRFPVVVSLVHGDDETSVRTAHKVDETVLAALHKYPCPVDTDFV